jgi:protocatechuate 3,4-dioxygenase beta subunit
LLSLKITSPDGAPLEGVLIDLWQANSVGQYDFAAYSLRGTARTDAQGRLDVLTIPPGGYGPQNYRRAGHFHFRIRPPAPAGGEKRYAGMTTQMYLCRDNDWREMLPD